jgi:hypothetical protein
VSLAQGSWPVALSDSFGRFYDNAGLYRQDSFRFWRSYDLVTTLMHKLFSIRRRACAKQFAGAKWRKVTRHHFDSILVI